MKKLLLFCGLAMCFFGGYAQSLTPSSTSIASGGTVVLTGSGESASGTYWNTLQSQSIVSVSPSSAQYYAVLGSSPTVTYYNPATGVPTSIALTFTNHSTIPLTVTYKVIIEGYNNVTHAETAPQTFNFTVTVAAATGTVYYNTQTSTGTTRNNCGAGYTGGYVLNTVPANSVTSTVSQSDANYQAFLIAQAGAQANANAYGTCTPNITYMFSVSSFSTTTTFFNLSVNGANISGAKSVVEFTPVVINDTNPINNSSTVVVQVTGGHIPTQAILEGPFTAIYGTISGSTITFVNVPLANGVGTGCGLLFY